MTRRLWIGCMFMMVLSALVVSPSWVIAGSFDSTQAISYLKEVSGDRFVRDAKGIITDRKTLLEWLEGPDKVLSWNDAQVWIKSLKNGWRAPFTPELEQLFVKNGGGGGSKNLAMAFRTTGLSVWSIKGHMLNIPPGDWLRHNKVPFFYQYNVKGENGVGSWNYIDYPGAIPDGVRVFAVRKNPKDERFVRNDQDIITDRLTGLQWLEGPYDLKFSDAQKWWESLGKEWRIPNQKELASLFVLNGGGGACGHMDPAFFIQGDAAWSHDGYFYVYRAKLKTGIWKPYSERATWIAHRIGVLAVRGG